MQVNLNKIRGLMAEHGDTQKDLAEKLGVSVTTVGNYLNGKTKMTIEVIGKIAQIYAATPLCLLSQEV